MIEYIKGIATELGPAYVVLEANGIGYMLNISLTTYSELQKTQGEKKLYVYESIREDAHLLFGFFTKRERDLFLLLISVSGVGPNTARMILSSLSPSDLEQSIATGNVSVLKAVKGIGAKTAQRIIVDLKDKINVVGSPLVEQGTLKSEDYDEALAALVMLGFSKQPVQKVLNKLFMEEPNITAEQAIKRALKMM
ncbi:MAG: Holliday junction branch migration protein RuvA [Bacteroidaceae bacterium]|nr:Holliday junction branch migration protein RuvA [Bacteroidaceae bacterium]